MTDTPPIETVLTAPEPPTGVDLINELVSSAGYELDVLAAGCLTRDDFLRASMFASLSAQLRDILETLDDAVVVDYDVDELKAAAGKWLVQIGRA